MTPVSRFAQAWFGVSDAGQLDGRCVLHTERAMPDVARDLSVSFDELSQASATCDRDCWKLEHYDRRRCPTKK